MPKQRDGFLAAAGIGMSLVFKFGPEQWPQWLKACGFWLGVILLVGAVVDYFIFNTTANSSKTDLESVRFEINCFIKNGKWLRGGIKYFCCQWTFNIFFRIYQNWRESVKISLAAKISDRWLNAFKRQEIGMFSGSLTNERSKFAWLFYNREKKNLLNELNKDLNVLAKIRDKIPATEIIARRD